MCALYKCSIGLHVLAICLIIVCRNAQALDYVGCYKDRVGERALDIQNEDVGSLQICQKLCQLHSTSTYFGLEDGLKCFCGETYDRYGKLNESECSSTCDQDITQKCGGTNRLSVYYVCPRGKFGWSCSNECQCSGGGFCNRRGTCLNGVGCEQGWEGETCSTDIDECELHGDCNQNCTNTPGSFYCSCMSSEFYLDTSNNRTCRGRTYVDECSRDNGRCAQRCQNTYGGYNCLCNEGFNSTDEGKSCHDIDECTTSNGGCSHYCNNTLGSFSCFSPENLKLDRDGHTDFSTNPWLIACIVLACILAVLLVAFPICLYLLTTYFRSKLNSSSGENSNIYLQVLQDDRTRSNEAGINIIRDVKPKNENKFLPKVIEPSGRNYMAATAIGNTTCIEYQEINPATENHYEQVNANEIQKELERQQKQTYTSIVK